MPVKGVNPGKDNTMDREQARQTIRERISCKDYLEKSKGGLYCCPYSDCNSGHGKNATGAVKLYPKTNTWYCHACRRSGDVIDLYQMQTGADHNTALSLMADEIGITIDAYKPAATTPPQRGQIAPQSHDNETGMINTPKDEKTPQRGAGEPQADYTAYYKECRERLGDPAAIDYLNSRGISIDTAKHYCLGFDQEADPASAPGGSGQKYHPCPRLIIPSSKGHYVGRRIDGITEFEKINVKGSTPAIFNNRALYAHDVQEVFVVEGAFDALSILEAGFTAIALNSAGNVNILLEQLEKRRTEATLILCPDNDSDPKTAETVKKEFDELAAGLQRLNIPHIRADINNGSKDANEALCKDRAAFIEAVANTRQKIIKPDNTKYYIDALMSADIERFKREISTGFNNLDKEMGGLYAGLYVLAAISSLGKTSFSLQLADQIAAGGNDVIFFSLEQSRLELVSKSIARKAAQENREKAVTSLTIRKGYNRDQWAAAAKAYKETVADRISIVEGNFACNITFIGDYVRQYIKRNNTRPVVIIDYLQILQPAAEDRRQSTKEIIDTTVTELKRLSRAEELTIIAISSVNRANYLQPLDFESLKESGGIEFSADVVMGLQLQCLNQDIFNQEKKIKEKREIIKRAKAADPRQIELVGLKNRFGKANFNCYFYYYPKNDLFVEDIGGEWEDQTIEWDKLGNSKPIRI